jgi:hypothetical protein
VVSAGKLLLLAWSCSDARQYLAQAGLAIGIDRVMVLLFAGYLLRARHEDVQHASRANMQV